MFCTISRPLTLHCRPAFVLLQLLTTLLHVPVKSGHGGGGVVVTMTLNGQLLVFPAASMAVQTTGLVPSRNVEPDGGSQLAVTVPQLSLAGTVKVTTASIGPTPTFVTMLPAQV